MERALIEGVLISASLGALIGLERQWDQEREHVTDETSAGLRTFTLWSLLGFSSALVGARFHTSFYPVAFGVYALFLGAVKVFRRNTGTLGLTTYATALLTFVLGSLVYWGERQFAMVLGIGMLVLLASKQAVHSWTRRLTPEDVRSALQFAAITGVVLPLVPNAPFGPFGALNPYKVWLMVVLIAGMGFLGYAAMRLMGEKAGIAVTGLVGGLASSTATTLAFSRRSRETPEMGSSLAMAVVLACTVMLARVAVVVAVLSQPVFQEVWPALLLMGAPGVFLTVWLLRQAGQDGHEVSTLRLSNPLSLGMAVKFALLYAAVSLAIKWVAQSGGATQVFLVSFLSGLTDMDAIAVSSAQSAGAGELAARVAAQAILIGALANTLLKGAFAISLGVRSYRRAISWALGATFLAGSLGFWLI